MLLLPGPVVIGVETGFSFWGLNPFCCGWRKLGLKPRAIRKPRDLMGNHNLERHYLVF